MILPVEDHGLSFHLWLGTWFLFAVFIFFSAGRLFMKPTGKKKKDLLFPCLLGITLLPFSIKYGIELLNEEGSPNFIIGIAIIMQMVLIITAATILPYFLLRLGMLSKKKRSTIKQGRQESKELE
jgi:hypothetical protein